MSKEDREKLKYIRRRRPSHESFKMLVGMLVAKQKTLKELMHTADKLIIKPTTIN